MRAQFFSQLTASHPVLREHVRQGIDTQAKTADALAGGGHDNPGLATSFAVLDAFLPWRGWPVGAVTEVMTDTRGCGELSLLLPAMALLTAQRRPVLCIGAPHELFAPALLQAGVDPQYVTQIHPAASASRLLKENLWSAEQALRTGLPGMVVLWSPINSTLPPEVLRRLHLAVRSGTSSTETSAPRTMLVHFRGVSSMSQPSPAWLRFGYAADDRHIRLQIIKCRGQELTRPLITIDRAALQARLYGQIAATSQFNDAICNGLSALGITAAGNSAHPCEYSTKLDAAYVHFLNSIRQPELVEPQKNAAPLARSGTN